MFKKHLFSSLTLCALVFLCGCQTGAESESKLAASDASGVAYHKDKDLQKVWLADDFDFTGYNGLYIAPARFAAKERTNEVEIRTWAMSYLQQALTDAIRTSGVFNIVSTNQSDLQAAPRL